MKKSIRAHTHDGNKRLTNAKIVYMIFKKKSPESEPKWLSRRERKEDQDYVDLQHLRINQSYSQQPTAICPC